MTTTDSSVSPEALTLAYEDPAEHRRLVQEWMTAYPDSSPAETGFIHQAVVSLLEKRRLERIRATLRTSTLRTAVLEWDRDQEDNVAACLRHFGVHCPSALVGLTRTGAGCRQAIKSWEHLAELLATQGTWYGLARIKAIQLQGLSANVPDLYISEQAFTTWIDCLGAQPNPKQKDIDLILNREYVPKALQDRDVPLWPRDPAECRARLQALVDRELPRLRALEETLRVQYEDLERAEAPVIALAKLNKETMNLLHAERIHEQSYVRAVTALLKLRKAATAARVRPVEAELDESVILVPPPATSAPTLAVGEQTGVGRSEHRAPGGRGVNGGLGAWERTRRPRPSARRRVHLTLSPKPRARSPDSQAPSPGA